MSPSGELFVSNATTGGAFDPDGFVVTVATGAPESLDLNKTLVLRGHPAGTYQVELTDIAPNCRTDQGNVRSVSIEDGSATRLHFDIVCTPPPELAGLRIVFSRSVKDLPQGPPRIVVMNADGSGSVELTSGAFWDQYPDVAPDARRIVFQSYRGDDPNGYPEIHLMEADGSAAVLLTGPAYMPDWSPDSRTIALVSPGDYGAGQIKTLNVDGGGAQALTTVATSPEHRGDFRPTWSPDGSRVAFLRDDGGARAMTASVWIVNADGSGETSLTEPLLDVGMSPVWSPDGRGIAFSAYDGPLGAGTTRIYSINANGSGLVTVLEAQGEPFAVTDWSADGAYLLLGRSNDLYLLRLADETMMRLTADGTYRDNQGARFWPNAVGSTRQ